MNREIVGIVLIVLTGMVLVGVGYLLGSRTAAVASIEPYPALIEHPKMERPKVECPKAPPHNFKPSQALDI